MKFLPLFLSILSPLFSDVDEFDFDTLFPPPRVVVFDCGGVIVGNVKFEDKYSELSERYGPVWVKMVQKTLLGFSIVWSEEFKEFIKTEININPQMHELINTLKSKGVQVAMLSNVDWFSSRIGYMIGLYDPFDPCLLSCEMVNKKPSHWAFIELLEALNTFPNDVVFVDDNPNNVRVANEIGMHGIHFTSLESLKTQLEDLGLLFI